MSVKVILVIVIQMIVVTIGDLSLSKGMKQLGPAPVTDFYALLPYAGRVFSSPYIIGGIVFLMLSFFLWLTVLSRADLSFALPITAVGYVLNAMAARAVLHEHVSLTRWAGTLVICLGVLVMSRG